MLNYAQFKETTDLVGNDQIGYNWTVSLACDHVLFSFIMHHELTFGSPDPHEVRGGQEHLRSAQSHREETGHLRLCVERLVCNIRY